MIVSINQPGYLPWLGYFYRIAVSDLHIVLDHVQFEKNSFTNRNKVRTAKGWCWLTVPVKTSGRFQRLPINEVEIDNGLDWSRKHWLTIVQNYRKAPYFKDHELFMTSIFEKQWTTLIDICTMVNTYLLQAFDISTPLVYSSHLTVQGQKSEMILRLCLEVGATVYLSGPLGRNYLDESAFRAQGISVEYVDYDHPVYPQVQGGFEPNMAAVDLLFNCGPDSRRILLTGGEGGRS